MAPRSDNLVHETATTTGTGNFTIGSVTARKTFNEAFGTGGTDLFWYCIVNRDANEWEVGTGHLLDATTLVRDTVIDSSNADALVSFTAGNKDVTSDIEWSSALYAGVANIPVGTDGVYPETTGVGTVGKPANRFEHIYLATDAAGGATVDFGDTSITRATDGALLLNATNVRIAQGNRIDLDNDFDTSIRASADDIITFESGGTDKMAIGGAAVTPSQNDGLALGLTTSRWSDLFLATRGSLAAGIDWGASSLVAATSGAVSVTGSYRHVAVSDGTSTNGAFTVSDVGGNMRTFVNGGSTAGMVPQTNDSVVVLFMENSATPGIVTATGDYDFVGGDALTTATGDDFILTSIVLNGRSSLVVQDATNNIV